MANVVFCDNCGAANPAGAQVCSQCRTPLYTASPRPVAAGGAATDDDGFRILTTGEPPTTRLPVAPPRARGPRGAVPGSLDDIPVAPRRAVRTDQQPPMVPIPGGLPEGIPKIELPTAPKIEPPKVEPPKGLLGFLKPAPPPAPTGRKESSGAPPEIKIPKWMIALVAVLALVVVAVVGAAAIKTGPFDNAPVTATALTQQTQVAAIFITQTHTVELAQATAWAQATTTTAAAGTATTLADATAAAAAVTALAAERAATAVAFQTALAGKDAAATVAVRNGLATQTALANALSASETQVGVAQTAIAGAQATAHALELQKSIQATMNALLTQVAPPPPPRPESERDAAPGLAARPSTAPAPAARSQGITDPSNMR